MDAETSAPLDLGPYREKLAELERLPKPYLFDRLAWLGRNAGALVAEVNRLRGELARAQAVIVGLRGEVAYLRGDTAGKRQEAERDARRCRCCGVGWDAHTAACPRHEYRPGMVTDGKGA